MTEKKWEEMTWQEKREVRFQKWLNPSNVKFNNPEAEKLYKQRVTRLIKAIKLEEPDRVPVMLPVGNFPAYYAGYDYYQCSRDYEKLKKAYIKFMDDFGDQDMSPSGMINSGPIAEKVQSNVIKVPGVGLPKDSSMHNINEGEYMMADEYDKLMLDPSDYMTRVNLPRTAKLFESFKKLPTLRHAQPASWIAALSDPEVRKTFQTLMDLCDEQKKFNAAMGVIHNSALTRGLPTFRGLNTTAAGAPFDHFADLLRGTRGIALDMYRQPKKLKEAMEFQLKLSLAGIKNAPVTGSSPVCFIALHKGDDAFMSDKQFEEFYWPGLRAIMMAMVEEGLVPMPFAEGKFTRRLKQIADTPKSSVIWWFDQTDMAEAKKTIGDICCVIGNVPTSVMKTGTAAQVTDVCRNLIETCGKGGGYILAAGASLDNGKFENFKAMQESATKFGTYK
ncbi:MAG TPA: uroporphyrinogen decarboxylase family protein [Dehalococcoidales bacterium]|nr:uroporphyrinogen decarboxylase family protein [Dehalococcoidales bacterium]